MALNVPHLRPVLGAHIPDGLEAQAHKDLAAGRWRQARDAFKELCKRDPTSFQPLVIEANIGLARAMLGKRLISDARQLLAYLRTVAPPGTIAQLEAEVADFKDNPPNPVADPVALLADGSLPPDVQRHWADQLVADFGRAEIDASTPARAQVAADLRAIHQGIESACLGDHERALELVRPLRRDSAFAHWRLFVRAIVAFQRNDTEKAAQYFDELPADSAPARASAAWRLVLGKRPGPGETVEPETVVEAAAVLSGHSGWGRVLVRAEALWRAGKHGASYRAMSDGKGSFPSEGVDLSAALSEFYFNAVFALHDHSRMAYEDFLYELQERRRAKNPTELALARRTLCLLMMGDSGGDFDPKSLRSLWEVFLRDHERVHGANPRLASVAWSRLGEVFARPLPQSQFARGTPKLTDAPGAIHALEKSIALDRVNAPAHLLLASVYAAAGRAPERNRLLDVMAKRFPRDKDVLLIAAAGCDDRKAVVKAVAYYESALALDRLDPATPNHLVAAYLRLARHHFEKRRLLEGRAVFDRIGELVIDSPENLVRGRWCVATRRSVLEHMHGNPELGAQLLDQARAISPGAAAFAFFARMAWSFYDAGKTPPASLQKELRRVAKESASAREATTLVQLWLYWTSAADARFDAETSWLRRLLKRTAKSSFTRDDAALLLAQLRTLPNFEREAMAFASAMLKRDRADPLFRLYKELLQPFPTLDRPQCNAILDEARRRADAPAEQLAHEVIAGLAMQPLGADPWEVGFQHLEDDDDGPDSLNGVHVLGVPPDDDEDIASFVALVASLPPSELARLRKKRPKGMSAPLFDALVSIAKAGMPHLEMPRARPSRPKPQRNGAPRSGASDAGKVPAAPPTEVPAVPPRKPPVPPDPQQVDLF